MARVFVTGSSTGLGLMAAQLLIEQGHQVVLHGRNQARANDAMASAPGAEAVVVGDFSRVREMKAVADHINRLGRFDVVIHNVGVGYSRGLQLADFIRPLHRCHVRPIEWHPTLRSHNVPLGKVSPQAYETLLRCHGERSIQHPDETTRIQSRPVSCAGRLPHSSHSALSLANAGAY